MKMKVRSQLLGGFALVLFLMVLSVGFGLSRMGQIQGRLDDIVTDKIKKTEAVHDMADAVREVNMALRGALLTEDEALNQDYKTRIDKARESYDKNEKFLEETVSSAE